MPPSESPSDIPSDFPFDDRAAGGGDATGPDDDVVAFAALQRVDILRSSPDGRLADDALALLLRIADSIDPATHEGDSRVHWLLLHTADAPEGLRRLYERASRSAFTPECRRAAALVLRWGGIESRRIDLRFAVAMETLRASRRGGGVDELMALLLAADCAVYQGRMLDSLAMTGRAMALAEQFRAAIPWARAAGMRTNLLTNLRLIDRSVRLTREMETRAARWTGRAGVRARFEAALARTNLALVRDDAADALRRLEVLDAIAIELKYEPAAHELFREVVRSWALPMLGRQDELAPSPAVAGLPHLHAELASESNRVAAILASQGASAAYPHAVAFLRRIESLSDEDRAIVGSGRLADFGSIVAEPLAKGGDVEASLRALDLAGRAAVERLAELSASDDVGDLPPPAAEDLEILTEAREVYARDHRDFLAAVARAIESGAAEKGIDVLRLLAARDELVGACAWCGAVRAEDGRWLPVEVYLPDTGNLTHGACPDCEARLIAGITGRSGGDAREPDRR